MASNSSNPKKLPKMQTWWPIGGEPKQKTIKLTKAKIAQLQNFHSYIKSYGWRNKTNG